jgi:hypothetical protein
VCGRLRPATAVHASAGFGIVPRGGRSQFSVYRSVRNATSPCAVDVAARTVISSSFDAR